MDTAIPGCDQSFCYAQGLTKLVFEATPNQFV